MARYAIIGATGTLGKALTSKLLERGDEVIGLSRDELKQSQGDPNVRWALADVRCVESLYPHLRDVDAVFHVAALKHIDKVEANPAEAIRTNILGTMNVVEACALNGVGTLAFASTDKAVKPINTYGFTKALSENYLLHCDEMGIQPCSVFRWGNVLGSRGSAIDFFVRKLKAGEPVPLTHHDMSRFWIDIDDAADFMLKNYTETGKVHIPPMKAAKVRDVVLATADLLGTDFNTFDIVGLRPGEKIAEAIFADATHEVTSDSFHQYSVTEIKALLTKHFDRISNAHHHESDFAFKINRPLAEVD